MGLGIEDADLDRDRRLGLELEPELVGIPPEPDDRFGVGRRQFLASPDRHRHRTPPLVVDLEHRGDEGLGPRVVVDAIDVAVAVVLAEHHGLGVEGTHGVEEAGPRSGERLRRVVGRGIHEEHGDRLQQVVLDHVADGADRVVERATAVDPERLGHRQLDALDHAGVHGGLDHRVGAPEGVEVLDRRLREEVVDGEQPIGGQVFGDRCVQLTGAGGVVAEGLLDHQAHPF